MEQGRNDRRVRRTKALLRQGLTTLLREKSVKDITVTELTSLADVNRGTFYCHYKDIYDLTEQLQEEFFTGFSDVLNDYSAEALSTGLGPILRDIYCFINKNADMCSAFFGGEVENSFFRRLKRVVYDKVSQEWGGLYGFPGSACGDYCLSFLVAGTVGLVQAWGRKERRESPEEMAILTEQLILSGITPMRQ